MYRRLGGPQGQAGWVWKNLPPPGFNPGPSSQHWITVLWCSLAQDTTPPEGYKHCKNWGSDCSADEIQVYNSHTTLNLNSYQYSEAACCLHLQSLVVPEKKACQKLCTILQGIISQTTWIFGMKCKFQRINVEGLNRQLWNIIWQI